MAHLHLLGTGAAVSDPHRTTTMLALENEASLLLVDCGGDVVQRLRACGLDPARVTGIVVTHEHADHVSGFPLMMERLWVMGRREPMDVYGIASALDQVRRIHDAFDTADWRGYPEIRYHEVPLAAGATVLADDAWHVTAVPGLHAVPVIGLRVTDRLGGGRLTYSSDTEYHPGMAEAARGTGTLVHEATGGVPGHASAEDAARVAAEAGVDRLILVHLPPAELLGDGELARARKIFPALEKGEEGGRYSF